MRKKDDPVDVMFYFQSTNDLQITIPQQMNTTLPQGPEYDSFNMQIVVKIIDDLNEALEFIIPSVIKVSSNTALDKNNLNSMNKKLYYGDLRGTSQVILLLASILNLECFESKKSLSTSGNIVYFSIKTK